MLTICYKRSDDLRITERFVTVHLAHHAVPSVRLFNVLSVETDVVLIVFDVVGRLQLADKFDCIVIQI